MTEIPSYALKRFTHPGARPRVTHVYSVLAGWTKLDRKPEFTTELASQLVEQGTTQVRLRWRREQHDVPVSYRRIIAELEQAG